ncbi:NAD(+) kinase, partial [Lunasporangiospora selenospora]
MGWRLKITHYQTSVYIDVPNLRPGTILERFNIEFPECLEQSSVLRWLDSDGDWIEVRKGDHNLEGILQDVVKKQGFAHVQSGDIAGLPPISNILIVTKPDPKLAKLTKELAIWLLGTFQDITIYVDKKLQDQSSFRYQEVVDSDPSFADRLRFWTLNCHKDSCQEIHLAVTLGGDGTVLYTAWMFQKRVPPMVAFHLGSLGFLTNFDFDSYRPTMTNILKGEGMNINIRMRLHCSVYKYGEITDTKYSPGDLGAHGGANHHARLHNPDVNQDASETKTQGESDTDGELLEEELQQQQESIQKAEIIRKVKEMDSKQGTEVADLGVCHEQGQALITRIPKPKPEEFMTPTDSWQ